MRGPNRLHRRGANLQSGRPEEVARVVPLGLGGEEPPEALQRPIREEPRTHFLRHFRRLNRRQHEDFALQVEEHLGGHIRGQNAHRVGQGGSGEVRPEVAGAKPQGQFGHIGQHPHQPRGFQQAAG